MFSNLNEKQKDAMMAGDGPLLIVAGAGSGKTKTLTARLAYLVLNRGVSPDSILAITFTNKAAEQMKTRIKDVLLKNMVSYANSPFVGTFHSFGVKVLRENASYFNRDKNFSIYDRGDTLKIIRELRKEYADNSIGTASSLLREISRIKSELMDKKHFVNSMSSELVWKFFVRYENRLEESNTFDFDDLIYKTVNLFTDKKDSLSKYTNKYKYILVDEYQDINTSQYLMIKLLSKKNKNINAVGDDQQSIYAFRFSDFRNFLNFENDWPNAKIVILGQNYRSTKNIVDASSALISNNILQKTKDLWTENKKGLPIVIKEHNDEFSQSDFVADLIKGYIKKKKSVGILFRTNAQSRALEHVFLDNNIDYVLFGAVSFYERKEIKDILAVLRVAVNPKDSASLHRMEKTFYKKKTKGLLDLLPEKSGILSPSELIEWVLSYTDYLSYIKRVFSNYREREENIAEFIYFATQFNDLPTFLEHTALSSALDINKRKRKKKKDFSGVSLMTIHLAKGLEFDVVILIGANEGLIPHQRSVFSDKEIEEERRLMYVAMTRAREELILSFYDIPSRFLSEIPSDMTDFSGDVSLDDGERYIEYD